MMFPLFLSAALLAQANGGPNLSDDPDAPTTQPAHQITTVSRVTVTTERPTPLRAHTIADPVICKSVEVTGTRFTSRSCMAKSQWEQQARDGKDAYEAWSTGAAINAAH